MKTFRYHACTRSCNANSEYFEYVFYHVTYALILNLHAVVARISRSSLLETATISEIKVIATGVEPTAI